MSKLIDVIILVTMITALGIMGVVVWDVFSANGYHASSPNVEDSTVEQRLADIERIVAHLKHEQYNLKHEQYKSECEKEGGEYSINEYFMAWGAYKTDANCRKDRTVFSLENGEWVTKVNLEDI